MSAMTLQGGANTGGRLAREVRDVMTPGVVTIPADAVHAVLVVDRKSAAPLGWISANGLLRWALDDSHHHTAGQAICEAVHMVAPSATLRDAAEILLRPGVSHVLVAHHGATSGEGVLSAADVVRVVAGR
jgi:signal-transduction protein with cAMP-binding, CBS, and nucleotidyltransferase domain